MATNNPYNRTFKTKREEYEEKLKQRNENEEWIFGNTFGRPGGGAPLRDKKGNVISNLKTITNGNIHRYEPQDFSKGDSNITVVNHKIYEKNNEGINNVISDPFSPFRNYINQFDSNKKNNNENITGNNNIILQNINKLNPNQITINQDQLDNMNIQNNQVSTEEQKKEIYLNQFMNNPYLIQPPYGIITQYPITHPFIPLFPEQAQTKNQIMIPNSSNNNLLINNYNNQIQFQQRPFSSISENVPNNISNNNLNNSNISNNISNYNNKNNNFNYSDITGTNGGRRKFLRKLPESTLFKDNDPEKDKLEKEKKLDDWKKELLLQINEKKEREAEEKRKQEEREKKEDLNIEQYYKIKKKQKEEQEKNHLKRLNKQSQNEVDRSGTIENLDLSNELEQFNQSLHSQSNQIVKDIPNNDFSQNNIQKQGNMNNNIDDAINNNFDNINYYSNNINQLYQNEENQNFKTYIDRQYHLLNETLSNDINNEMKRISEEIDKNYAPFTQKFLLMNTNSKTTAELSLENEKKLKKIQNLIEERKIVDYILGQRQRPPTPKKEDEELEKEEMPVPSFFGLNRDKAENKYLGLHSKSSFITKNENIANFIASGRNQNVDSNIPNVGNDLIEKQNINNNFNLIMNDELDINSNFNQKANTRKATFGTNIHNDESLGGSINLAKNLDNISTFIPLGEDRKNINSINEQKMKFLSGIGNDFGKYKDKDMEDLFKDLDKIYELTNKIDVTSKARNISEKFENDLNRKINLNLEQFDELSLNDNNNNSKYIQKNNLNLNQEIISEEKSNGSLNKNLTNSNKVSENKHLIDSNKESEIKNSHKESENSDKSKNSKNINNENINYGYDNLNNNGNKEEFSNKELNSYEEKSSNSQNEKDEASNNFNNNKEQPKQEEEIEENYNQSNINKNEKKEPQNVKNNDINENQNSEEGESEYTEEEEEVEQQS